MGKMETHEIDGRLLPVLQRTLGDFPNVEVIHADILETDVDALVGSSDYSVVANLPYYITSAVMRHLLETRRKPRRLIGWWPNCRLRCNG